MSRLGRSTCGLLAALLLGSGCAGSSPAPRDSLSLAVAAPDRLVRSLLRELVEIDTSGEHGTTVAAQAMAARLRSSGWPASELRLVGENPQKLNLVARLRGRGLRPPILLLAHLDVVAAPEGSELFSLREHDGALYGRGTLDDKAMAALWLATLLRFRAEGYVPDRDLILALTADEEEGEDNGVRWLLKNQRSLVDAGYCLNEGGTGELRRGRYLANEIQLGEKSEAIFTIRSQGPGGNSAQPPLRSDDGAIERLAAGLARLRGYRFPLRLTELSRAYLFHSAATVEGQLQADMLQLGRGPIASADAAALARVAAASSFYAAVLRTTCVPTLISGGHAEGALSERAEATLNCRLLPGETAPQVQELLVAQLADPQLHVELKTPIESAPPSPPQGELWRPVAELTQQLWPGAALVPLLLPASTDGRFLRAAGIPTYGVSGLFVELDEAPEHSSSEHVGIQQLAESREFLYRLLKRLTS